MSAGSSISAVSAIAALRTAARPHLRAWINQHALALTSVIDKVTNAQKPAWQQLGRRDVGEKIGFARKDLAALLRAEKLAELEEISVGAAYKAVTKAAVLGEFDAHAARTAGDTAGCAYLKQELYHAIATRPDDSPKARAYFVEGCGYLREHLPACHSVKDILAFLEAWSLRLGRRWKIGAYTQGMHAAEVLERDEYINLFGSDSPGYKAHEAEGYAQVLGRDPLAARPEDYAMPGETNSIEAIRRAQRAPPVYQRFQTYRFVPVEETLRAYGCAISLGPRFMGAVIRFSEKDGRHPVTFHRETREKAEIYERNEDWSWCAVAEAPAAQRKQSAAFVLVRFGLAGIRQGVPEVGKVTGHQLVHDFGLRGLEHGLWMSDDNADTGERAAYGALLDLASVLDVPSQWIGFGGRLGLALGARGSGKFAAHYETSFRVINLTKTQGAGAFAHEWGHALDHYLADLGSRDEKGKGVFCSQGASSGNAAIDRAFRKVMVAIIGPEVDSLTRRKNPEGPRRNPDPWPVDAHGIPTRPAISLEPIVSSRDLEQRIRAANEWLYALERVKHAPSDSASKPLIRAEFDAHTLFIDKLRKVKARWDAQERAAAKGMKKDTRQLTQYCRDAEKLGEYWARPQELFARAWESYVEDVLTNRGQLSTFLVMGTGALYAHSVDALEPYPQGEERVIISKAIYDLVQVLKREVLREVS